MVLPTCDPTPFIPISVLELRTPAIRCSLHLSSYLVLLTSLYPSTLWTLLGDVSYICSCHVKVVAMMKRIKKERKKLVIQYNYKKSPPYSLGHKRWSVSGWEWVGWMGNGEVGGETEILFFYRKHHPSSSSYTPLPSPPSPTR